MPQITIHISCESEADLTLEESGFSEEQCKDAKTLLEHIRTEWSGSRSSFLSDFDMLYDMDVKIGVTRVGDVHPDQLTLDGEPATLPPQHTWADWS